MAPESVHASLEELVSSFHELNGSAVEELDQEPSPLEFMRFVSRNTPFVVRGGASQWKATRAWDSPYLLSALSGQTVNVAVTPHGNADSPTLSQERTSTVFAKPLEEDQDFGDFLDYLIRQETGPASPSLSEVRYAQTQNDNLRDEYIALFPDAQKDIPFARIALQKEPDAVNMWIGNSRSVTAAHKDNFENIYVQIRGRKHFVLLPPLCHPCMNEKLLTPATYVRNGDHLALRLDPDAEPVPFATWDPSDPDGSPTALSRFAKPLHVSLDPGDMLYLPAMWYHKVTQSCIAGEEPFVVALNYWYDMEFSGPLYPLTTFVRDVGLAAQHQSSWHRDSAC